MLLSGLALACSHSPTPHNKERTPMKPTKKVIFIDWNALEWTFYDTETNEYEVGTMNKPTFSSVKDALYPYGLGVGRTKTVIVEKSIAVCEGYDLK